VSLIDLHETAHIVDGDVRFHAIDRVGNRFVVQVTREAVADLTPGGPFSLEKFNRYREHFGAIAGDKFHRGRVEPGPFGGLPRIIVRPADIA
jgi:hypothetical protein